MKKQQYINILEEVVLRPPNKIQECSFQVKIINSSAAFFKDFAYSFRPFIFKNSQVSLLSSNNLSFFDYPTNKYLFRVNNRKSRECKRHFQVSNKNNTSISIVGLNIFLLGMLFVLKSPSLHLFIQSQLQKNYNKVFIGVALGVFLVNFEHISHPFQCFYC